MTSFKKCPIDGYDMDKTYEDFDPINPKNPTFSIWTCRGCGFEAKFDLKYIKGLDKKKW